MSYIIISDRTVCGKNKSDSLTEKELQDAGVSAETLIAGNHIKAITAVNQETKVVQSIKQETKEGAIA
jgi:predicted methyltransferase